MVEEEEKSVEEWEKRSSMLVGSWREEEGSEAEGGSGGSWVGVEGSGGLSGEKWVKVYRCEGKE